MKLTQKEVQKAIETINRLCSFEGRHRLIRGHGEFKSEELPVPELVKLIQYLKAEWKLDAMEKADMCLVTTGNTFNDLQSLDWKPEDGANSEERGAG